LKDLEFVPEYTSDVYNGPAIRLAAGVQSWELHNLVSLNGNLTIVSPVGSVGPAGGWFASGGHGIFSSKLGLGSDQVLSVNLVTADGKFLTADPKTNKDLFWALRGGGPSKYTPAQSGV